MKDNNSMAEAAIWCDSCGEEYEEFETVGELKYCPDCWEKILEASRLDFVRQEGGVACQAGIPLTENPYHADRQISEKKAWEEGWSDEEKYEKARDEGGVK